MKVFDFPLSSFLEDGDITKLLELSIKKRRTAKRRKRPDFRKEALLQATVKRACDEIHRTLKKLDECSPPHMSGWDEDETSFPLSKDESLWATSSNIIADSTFRRSSSGTDSTKYEILDTGSSECSMEYISVDLKTKTSVDNDIFELDKFFENVKKSGDKSCVTHPVTK